MNKSTFADFVAHEYKKYDDMSINTFHKLRLDPTISYFVPNTCDLSGERIKTFNINLTGDEFYIIDGYFLLYRKNAIRIYKYDERFNFTRLRRIGSHLLVFLVRKNAISRECRFFFYNILLNLVRNNEKKYDSKLKDIMCYMCVDWLSNIKICREGIACSYRNGELRLYDSRLQIISQSNNLTWNRDRGIIKSKTQTVKVSKDEVEVIHNDRSFRDLLTIKGIKQHITIGNNLFLLTKDSIKILSFED